MLGQTYKRKPLVCLTNTPKKLLKEVFKSCHPTPSQMMPDFTVDEKISDCKDTKVDIYLQNKHPLLAMYNAHTKSDDMSFSDLSDLLLFENENKLIDFLTDVGIFPTGYRCEFCGFHMRKVKQINIWYWICTRRHNGIKCNKGKFGIRKGTFLDHTHFNIQTVMRIVWNFVYRLSVSQCKQYAAISAKTDHTVVEYYADCRRVCTSWIWDERNIPKLGGFGKIVEFDESYFPGAPKYNKGRRLGTNWDDDDKWVFGLTERDNLNCVLVQIPSNRKREQLLPIINQHCLQGTIFTSDGWKAYHKLAEHLPLEDCLHFTVNHSENYVDPDSGAHTQTIEGLWGHVKDFLPVRGMKPADLGSYLGWFMWDRNCREIKKDKFLHFLRCAAYVRPPCHKPELQIQSCTLSMKAPQTNNESDDDFCP